MFMVFLVSLSHTIEAETYLRIHTLSYHSNRSANFNESNYGIGIHHYLQNKKVDYFSIGTYKNSESNQSHYTGFGLEYPIGEFKFGVSFGFVTGYESNPVNPYVVSNIRYKIFNVIISPFVEPVIHLTIDILKF